MRIVGQPVAKPATSGEIKTDDAGGFQRDGEVEGVAGRLSHRAEMGRLAEFLRNYRSKRDLLAIVYYRMGRRKFLLTRGVLVGALLFAIVEAMDHFRHERELKGCWLVGYLILGLAIWCGAITWFASSRWRNIEQRAQQPDRP